jgi:gentisate 1,2-dioxygenase
MTDTLNPALNQDYDDRVAALSTVPSWRLPEMHEPSGPERPHVWRWADVVPELLSSQHLVGDGAGELQRRALLLANPGLRPPAFGATPTLVAAYQALLPGELAPVHAHSFSALRFGASGADARMVVDGQSVPMYPGDLVLTPAWCWHGHVHTGGEEPVVRFDGLDVPLLVASAPASTKTRRQAWTGHRSATRQVPTPSGSGRCPPAGRLSGTRRCAAIPGTRRIRPSSACWPCPTATPCSSIATRSPAGRRWRRSPARCTA